MQEKRNKGLFVLFLLLVTTTAVLVYTQQRSEEKFDQKDIFKVEDLKAIDRVELRSGKDTISLSFSGNRWMVNGSEPADRDMVDVLFATLLQAEAKRFAILQVLPVGDIFLYPGSLITRIAKSGLFYSPMKAFW